MIRVPGRRSEVASASARGGEGGSSTPREHPPILSRVIPEHLVFLSAVYVTGIVFLSAFRLILFLAVRGQAAGVPSSILIKAFGIGFRFDTVVSAYLLSVPFVLLTVAAVRGPIPRWWQAAVAALVWLGYGFLFLAGSVDIPYFQYFFTRLTVAVLNWTETPGFMFKIVVQDRDYYPYIALFVASWGAFGWLLSRLRARLLERAASPKGGPAWAKLCRVAGFSLVAAALLFVGARGRITRKSPIRMGTAFFSTYALPNQLGLNPAFTFVDSVLDLRNVEGNRVDLMAASEALRRARSYLGLSGPPEFDSPIARRVVAAGHPLDANVVLVIMESMAAARMARFGGAAGLTPVLDSLASQGWSFDNVYTSGIHTFNGIYSTLFSLPTILGEHPMKGRYGLRPFAGIGRVLAGQGYHTAFFTTHDAQFDNMAGFLSNNGYQDIVSLADYPRERVVSTLGVPDHYMFEFAVPLLDRWAGEGRPFFTVFLTASNHGPYVIPPGIGFVPRSGDPARQVVEYSDWSLGHFLELARTRPWFRNTIFAFVADHGANLDSRYDMPLTFHHTPFIVYAPELVAPPRSFPQLGGQIDIAPTLLGILNRSYVDNGLGVDLLRAGRPFAFFASDDKIGCVDQTHFYVKRMKAGESLYSYREGDTHDVLADDRELADRMRDYAVSMIEAAQWLVEQGKAGPPKPMNAVEK